MHLKPLGCGQPRTGILGKQNFVVTALFAEQDSGQAFHDNPSGQASPNAVAGRCKRRELERRAENLALQEVVAK